MFHHDFHQLNQASPRNPDPSFKAAAEDVAKLPFLFCNPFKDWATKININ